MEQNLTRGYWLDTLEKIVLPVLEPLARRELCQTLTLDADTPARADTSYLEAFGRSVAGIAPWLEAAACPGEEKRHARMQALVRCGLRSAVDLTSRDRMDFLDHDSPQPIVDAAFLAYGLLRGWESLWEKNDKTTRRMTIEAFKGIRDKKPFYNNWLLFSAMIEAFMFRAGEDFDEMRLDYALRMFDRAWYAGDGLYSDGDMFHMDYYNSYVIQPMLMQILDTVGGRYDEWLDISVRVMQRAQRYAAVQERMIAPDGSFPVVGRSICYRMGAFHHLADMALREFLPMPPASVRSALTAVIRRCVSSESNFNKDGYLTVGLCGAQPSLRESYITTGSLYLCTTAFLPLGLPPQNPFWQDPDEDWTSKAVWSGQDAPADHAED